MFRHSHAPLRSFLTVLAALSAAILLPPAAVQSQVLVPRNVLQLNYGSCYGPGMAAAMQIHAEAEYLRGYGEMQRDLADARIRHAEARKVEIKNRVDEVLSKIEIRQALDAERARLIRERIAKRRENNEKTWERLKHHPELTAGEIVTGKALNFLKNRLATNVVTYQPSDVSSSGSTNKVTEQLQVTPALIHALQVRQMVGRGESLVFRLDDGQPIQVDWWPPALRTPELKSARTNFEKARADVFAAEASDQFDPRIKKLLLAHAALQDDFLDQQPHAQRIKTQQSIHDYLDGKAVLSSLLSEIRRMQRVGPNKVSARDLAFRGSELTEMLTHMVRNGLEFAPAKPGDEQAYQQMFYKLRDLYLAVEADAAESNGSGKPRS